MGVFSFRKGKNMKRQILAVGAMLFALNVPCISYAAVSADTGLQAQDHHSQIIAMSGEEGIQPFYENTINISAGLKINGSTASARASVTAKYVCNVNIVMRLQRKVGSDWHTIVSWVAGSADGFKNLTKTHTLTTRGTYRVYALFDVDGEKLEYVGNTATY